MKTRKLLNELTRDELSALYDANSYIKETIYTRRADDESDYILNEIVSYFAHYDNITNRRKFSALFDERYNNCMIDVKIENYPDFISDCLEFDKNSLGFSDEIKPLLKRLAGRAQFYVDCYFNYENISDKNYLLLDEWIKTGVNKVKRELEKLVNDIYDSLLDDDYNKEYFIESVLEFENFDDMTTDGRNVFFEVCRG